MIPSFFIFRLHTCQPLYQLVTDHLRSTTSVLFDQKDFTQRELLSALYHSLQRSLSTAKLDDELTIYAGLDCRSMVAQFRGKLLQIFKLLLLEKR